MVKNSTGGNKSKKQARKTTLQHQQPAKEIRKAKEDGEIYAAVSKMFGGKECEVMCTDHKSRRCVMRSKFSFRGKAENNLSVGTMILVGLRDWEVRHTGSERCDLLEVYSQSEKERLKQSETCDFSAINSILLSAGAGAGANAGKNEDEVFSNFQTMDESDNDNDNDNDTDSTDSSVDIDTNNSIGQNKVVPTKKETIENQVDWLIDEKDI